MLVIVFDPRRLGTGQYFEHEARSFIDWVQSAPLREGVDAILMPGDPERASRKSRAELIPIDTNTLAQLDGAAVAVARHNGTSPGPLSALQVPG
jgi:hydroxycarboxylate dehydrogenase B